MKYVRTKDGRIVEIPNKHKEIVYDGNVIISVEKIINGVKGQEIITGLVDKKADTIEELCDEFVTSYIDGFHQLTSFPSKVDAILGHSVYGAIWTDKGLIYVAKMNDKGELELL